MVSAMVCDPYCHRLEKFFYHACGNGQGFHLEPKVSGNCNGHDPGASYEVWLGFSALPLQVMQICAKALVLPGATRPVSLDFAEKLIKPGSFRAECRDAAEKLRAALATGLDCLAEDMRRDGTNSLTTFAALWANNKVLEKVSDLDLGLHWKQMEAEGDEIQVDALHKMVSHDETVPPSQGALLSAARASLQDHLESRRRILEIPDESVSRAWTEYFTAGGLSLDHVDKVISAMQEKIDLIWGNACDSSGTSLTPALRQFEKRVEAIIGTGIQAERKRKAASLFEKGFTLRQILEFVEEHFHKRGVITPAMPTHQVVRQIIIPETKAKQCCYADILPGGPTKPETLMSHWWGNSFLALVLAICEHAAGKQFLYVDMYTEEELRKSYWLCIFGVNQHVSICGTTFNPCDCGGPKHVWGMQCQMDKFSLMMDNIPNHALALDPSLRTVTRVWVLSELDEALHGNVEKLTCFCGNVDPEFQINPSPPSVEQAEASFPSDKDLIVGKIKERTGGTAEFDYNIGGAIKDAIAIRRIFRWIEEGKYAEFEEDLRSRPKLMEATQVTNRGETPLLAAAREGHVFMVQLLLDKGARVTARSKVGWTALHYAAICENKGDAAAVISLLISADADLAAVNDFGRHPLEEALLAGAPKSVIGLLSAEHVGQPADWIHTWVDGPAYMQLLGDQTFLPHPKDTEIFGHWKLRMSLCFVMQPIGRELVMTCHWVQPRSFESIKGRVLDEYIGGMQRMAAYINHRWPFWKFESLAALYCGQGYRLDLTELKFTAVRTEDCFDPQTAPMQVPLPHKGMLRYLYP